MNNAWTFTNIPGAGKNWLLTVFAVSKQDACNYVENYNGGGRCIGEWTPSDSDKYSCAAVTPARERKDGAL